MAEAGEEEESYDNYASYGGNKKGNNLPFWGNQATMNLNPLILANIQNSPYFKVNLAEVKTYHEVVDEIYYKVNHLEPWERGSRNTSNVTGMCGGVRGVGTGGIVSSSFCLLYKLATLKLTRKQVNGLCNHCDSPYIRGLGFMYIRFTQPPEDFLEWYDPYLDDEEEVDVKAGGGKIMTMGEMVKAFMLKLEWFDTRFPRIPVNVQKEINQYLEDRGGSKMASRARDRSPRNDKHSASRDDRRDKHSASRDDRRDKHSASRDNKRDKHSASRDDKRDKHSASRDDRSRDERRRSRDRDDKRRRSRDRKRSRSRDERRRSKSRDRRSKSRDRHSKSRDRRSRSRDRHSRHHKRDHKEKDFGEELKIYSEHRKKSKKHKKSRSRSGSRHR